MRFFDSLPPSKLCLSTLFSLVGSFADPNVPLTHSVAQSASHSFTDSVIHSFIHSVLPVVATTNGPLYVTSTTATTATLSPHAYMHRAWNPYIRIQTPNCLFVCNHYTARRTSLCNTWTKLSFIPYGLFNRSNIFNLVISVITESHW